jgi:hypothetical protein
MLESDISICHVPDATRLDDGVAVVGQIQVSTTLKFGVASSDGAES